MDLAHSGKMRLERPAEPLREQGDTFAHAFAFADDDLAVAEIDILDAQAQALEQAEAASIEEMGHEAVIAFEVSEDGTRFCAGEDNGPAWRPLHAFHPGEVVCCGMRGASE